jgi:hypothetical protein
LAQQRNMLMELVLMETVMKSYKEWEVKTLIKRKEKQKLRGKLKAKGKQVTLW